MRGYDIQTKIQRLRVLLNKFRKRSRTIKKKQKENKMNGRFKYQKFRKPIEGEQLSSFFYEFYQHLEAEFERLTEYILSIKYEDKE